MSRIVMSFDFSVLFFSFFSFIHLLSGDVLQMLCGAPDTLWFWEYLVKMNNSQRVINQLWVKMNLIKMKIFQRMKARNSLLVKVCWNFKGKAWSRKGPRAAGTKWRKVVKESLTLNPCEVKSGTLHPIPTSWVPKTQPDFDKVIVQQPGWAGGWRTSSRGKGWGAGAPSGWTMGGFEVTQQLPSLPRAGQRQAHPRGAQQDDGRSWNQQFILGIQKIFSPIRSVRQWSSSCPVQSPALRYFKPWATWAEPVADPALSRNLDLRLLKLPCKPRCSLIPWKFMFAPQVFLSWLFQAPQGF